MSKYVKFNADDKITDTSKVTTGYFTGGVGTLAGTNFVTASISSSQKAYYHNIQYSSTDQFSVSYGHQDGSGSNITTNKIGATEAVYKQYSSILLEPDEVIDGFQFDGTNTVKDTYFIVAKRSLMKDRCNKKNWTLVLSGSGEVSLTDDSDSVAAVATVVGPRYNIVSGALGTVKVAASTTKYGWFYPNVGIMVLDPSTLTGSVSGLAPTEVNDGSDDNAHKLYVAINSGSFTLRSEEDQTTVSYFCRAKANDFNYSSNPTFVSGALNEMRQQSFEGNPQTYITSVGLYNNNQELVAVAKLSTPIKKNYSSEAVVKVNLTY